MVKLKNPYDRRKLSGFDILINTLCIIILILVIGWTFRANLKIEQFDVRQEILAAKIEQQEQFNNNINNQMNNLSIELKTFKTDINHKLDNITNILLNKK